MGILQHFDTDTWKVGIVQNLCEYCRLFLCDSVDPKCLDTPNSHTTNKCIARSSYLQWCTLKFNLASFLTTIAL